MEKNNIWVPLLTSIGVGAITYYTISKNNNSLGQTVQKFMPLMSQMGMVGTNGNQQSNS